ncbi:uncharacterized protein LOC119081457 [Bradysia coprophila]|uniref:uncharacterized protein LOC119075255 n=1 Tax=Bradysia coprophila TaxID=38358 RepID=UPI00187DB6E6|nr:uncharacterized protein LOC119075255 [Bradysia coprophila]XP_037046353.1 uncharacterized protein LOC119081457 [Bradysia coprophila]
MTLTLHFVDKQFALVNLTLSTNHFADRHKGENVLPYIESLLDCYGLTQKNIYMVTDAAKNMKKTCNLGSYENISCVGHALHNLVSVDGIKKTEPIKVLLKKIKDIVKALRYRTDEFEKLTKDQSALAAEISEWSEMFLIYDDVDDVDNDLESLASSIEDSSDHRHTLKLDVKTRWHSVLMMVESLVGYNKNVINLMLHKTDNSELVLLNSDILLAKELVDFLRHFQRITAIFSVK